jgi:acyl-CoA thioesterase FadM
VVLLFRVFLVILRSLLQRPSTLLDPSVLHMRVWPTDIDLNFHLNDGRYVSLTGVGRTDLLARTRLLRDGIRRGWYPVVGATMIRYRREIRAFQRFTLRSRILCWDEKWFYFEHFFESQGALAAVAYVRGLLRTRSGLVPSSDVLALLGHTAPSPPLPPAIERWRQADIP